MAAEIPQDIMQEASSQVNSVKRRVLEIQKKSEEIEVEIFKRNFTWQKNIDEFNYQLELIENDFKEFKKDFITCVRDLSKVTSEFKTFSKKLSFDNLKEKIESKQFEKLITKEQFNKLLKL